MRRLQVALVLVLFAMPSHAAVWEFVADLTDANLVLKLVPDPAHKRLLMGTTRGYRVYEPLTESWLRREPGGYMGSYKVLCFLSDPFDSLALLTGREDASWYGYIMDNTGLTELGPIIMAGWDPPAGEEARGGVWGIGRAIDTSATLFACTLGHGAHGYILRSEDGGLSWETSLSITDGGWDLDIAPDGAVLVAHGSPGYPYTGHGILRSTDSGDTWLEISGDMPCAGAIGDVAIDPDDSRHLYARQGGTWEPADPALGVYETLDGGLHWQQVLQGNVYELAMHPDDASMLVAVLPGAIQFTRDSGRTWEDITGNVPWVVGVERAAICPTDARIYVADDVDGMWAMEINPTAADPIPSLALALRAFPNPFNPTTTLSFSMECAGTASMSIVDVRGRVVRRLLVAEAMQAGQQTMTWDGRDDRGAGLPSGLYFANLDAGGQRASLKLLLLK